MPYYTYTFDTPLPPPTVEERIRGLIRPKLGFTDRVVAAFERISEGPPFTGSIAEGSFKVVRVIGHTNTFLPTVRGTYTMNATSGTRVRLRMVIPPAAAGFMCIWFGGLLWMLPKADGQLRPYILGMIAAGVVLVVAAFFPEARKAKRLLEEALSI